MTMPATQTLLVDVGNTSLKIGVGDAHGVSQTWSLATDTRQSGDSLGLSLAQLLAHGGVDGVDDCVVSSVVPGMDPLLTHACERFLRVTPRFANQTLAVPLDNRYERAHEVGADRLVAAYAARVLVPEPQVVISVDFGTATTFDVVKGQAYLGGLICPGVMSSLGALATRTARLPSIALMADTNGPIVGRNTTTSLNHGFLFGFAALTEGVYGRLVRELCTAQRGDAQPCAALVATGGYAAQLATVTDCFDEVRPDLILEGLRLLWLAEARALTPARP